VPSAAGHDADLVQRANERFMLPNHIGQVTFEVIYVLANLPRRVTH